MLIKLPLSFIRNLLYSFTVLPGSADYLRKRYEDLDGTVIGKPCNILLKQTQAISDVLSFLCLILSLQAASAALSSLGHVYTAIGDYPNALASHKQCVLLAKQSKDELSEARELGNMGAVYIAMGDFENAVQCHEQHLKIAKDLGNKREEARAYSNLGSAYHYRRNFDKAMSYHNHVLELAQELVEKAIEMRAYAGLGHAARCMQDLERAKRYHEQQLGIAEDLKDRAAEGRASSNLGKDRIACKVRSMPMAGNSWRGLYLLQESVFRFRRTSLLRVLCISCRYISLEPACSKSHDPSCHHSALRIRIQKYWKNKTPQPFNLSREKGDQIYLIREKRNEMRI